MATAAGNETCFDAQAFEAGRRESQAVSELHLLNAAWIRAFEASDLAWYGENLHDDFVCTLPNGHQIGKHEFQQSTRRTRWRIRGIRCDDVDVRLLGDVALVHGVMHYRFGDTLVVARYTTVWQSRQACWRAVATQLTRVGRRSSADVTDVEHTRGGRWFRRR